MPAPSLEGRRFRDVTDDHAGDVGTDTVFDYHQDGEIVWAPYAGGSIRLGFLVGKRHADTLSFRYSHITVDGQTASGRCTSTITVLPDGRLECLERWQWESRPGAGTSIIRELTAA